MVCYCCIKKRRGHFKTMMFLIFVQLKRHPLIELFHLSSLLQMLNDCRMVNIEFLDNFSCSCKRISFDDGSQFVFVNLWWLPLHSSSSRFSSPLQNFLTTIALYAKSLQSCPTLCDPIDGSPPGFPIPGILQARTLEWVAISFSNAWKWKEKVKSLSRVQLSVTPWTAAHQAPPSMGFSRQEYWSGMPLPSVL